MLNDILTGEGGFCAVIRRVLIELWLTRARCLHVELFLKLVSASLLSATTSPRPQQT